MQSSFFLNEMMESLRWRRCFLMNFAEFFITPFSRKTSGGCFCFSLMIVTSSATGIKKYDSFRKVPRYNCGEQNQGKGLILQKFVLFTKIQIKKKSSWSELVTYTAQKIKFTVKDFFSKCDQIRSFLQIWSHLLKKSLMVNYIFMQ